MVAFFIFPKLMILKYKIIAKIEITETMPALDSDIVKAIAMIKAAKKKRILKLFFLIIHSKQKGMPIAIHTANPAGLSKLPTIGARNLEATIPKN